MKLTNQLSKEKANELFYYDSGILYWKENSRGHKKDAIAGSKDKHGYFRIGIGNKRYYRHNIIWNMFNGLIPENMVIDHIIQKTKGGSDDINNLRLVNYSGNSENRITKSNSGHKNIYYLANRNKPWMVNIRTNKVSEQTYFDNISDAIKHRDTIRKQNNMIEIN